MTNSQIAMLTTDVHILLVVGIVALIVMTCATLFWIKLARKAGKMMDKSANMMDTFGSLAQDQLNESRAHLRSV